MDEADQLAWCAVAVLVMRSHGLEHLHTSAELADVHAGTASISRRYRIYRGGWRLREVQMSALDADASCFLSEEERGFAVERLRVPAERAHVVQCWVPTDVVSVDYCPDKMTPLRIAMLGSYLPHKGFAYAFPAPRRLLEDYSSWTLSSLGTERRADFA